MKKFVLFFALALFVSSFSTGCTSSGSSSGSWCRLGSLFPTTRSRQNTETVYLTSGARNCEPCDPNQCQPCEPTACQPCEPASCQPCDPVCNPCDMRSGIVTGAIIPHPAN